MQSLPMRKALMGLPLVLVSKVGSSKQPVNIVHGYSLAANSNPPPHFEVDPAIARNCISINPCQQDSTIIRDAEMKANIVNTCGRTELKGNIDVGENTENALASKAVTQVKAGSEVTVTLHQVNADGAGPYVCDIDMTSNAGVKFTVSLCDAWHCFFHGETSS